jgi:uncharacterized protein (DUF58 family)
MHIMKTPQSYDVGVRAATVHEHPSHDSLLGPTDIQRLERMSFKPARRFAGANRGERISTRKGISVELSDFRDYTPGDDLRHLDWSILARLDRPTIRTYQDEDELAIYVVLDDSLSMNFGAPSKFLEAKRLAAAVGIIGLSGHDAVCQIALSRPHVRPRFIHGHGGYPAILRWAALSEAKSTTGVATSLVQFSKLGTARPGIVVVISDFLDEGAPDALRAISARGHQLAAIQVLSRPEIDPDIEGDLRLHDIETGEVVEITAHNETLRIYRQNLANHNQAVELASTRSGGKYRRFVAGTPVVDFLTRELARTGIVG